ncbi:hypothetical protein N7495_000097 [Penicillium taxi]|uniref:uncharacterized protein n=1 Tax=Penicillium taxi TaxID=168475 RepID=UPI0025459036|nr:uncharacterized protein N7495_000097 [Penicillium taxi]KAJ5907415.1 hypothetical protein N7495_000097 [Penicillium taxi]
MIMLIVFRALSGIGGGGIITSAMIVVTDVVSLEKRGAYQGFIGMVVSFANALGPLIGGIFTEKVSWRWCFSQYINIPLTSVALVVAVFALPLKPVTVCKKLQFKQIDYLGCTAMLLSAVLILLPISWGGTQYAWNSAAVIAPLVIGIVSLGVFILVEIKIAALPLIPMHIFKIPTVAGASTVSFFSGFMFYANLYYLPQFFQVILSASPIKSGVLLLPLIVIQSIVSFTSGFIVSKTGNYTINLRVGFIIWTIACGLLSTINPNTSIAKLVGYQILSGVGSGQTFQTALIAIQAGVKTNEMAVATSTRNFVLQTELSSVISVSALKAIVADPTQISSTSLGLTGSQKSAAIQAYTHGIRNIYYFMVACCFISFLLSVYPVRGQSLKREDDAKRQEEGKQWAVKNKGIIGIRGKKNPESSPKKIEEGLTEVTKPKT